MELVALYLQAREQDHYYSATIKTSRIRDFCAFEMGTIEIAATRIVYWSFVWH
jgi:hypothetical protein